MATIVQNLASTSIGQAQSVATNVLFKPLVARKIGWIGDPQSDIVALCVMSEHHTDQYVITDHPTEFGASISDHMYALPKKVDIEVIYSRSQNNTNGVFSNVAAIAQPITGSTLPTLNQYYQRFLDLQSSKIPFTIVTGKRTYTAPQSNTIVTAGITESALMVIETLECKTDPKSENILKLSLRCRSIQQVSTKNTATFTTLPNPSNMANPTSNAPPTQSGTSQMAPATATDAQNVANLTAVLLGGPGGVP